MAHFREMQAHHRRQNCQPVTIFQFYIISITDITTGGGMQLQNERRVGPGSLCERTFLPQKIFFLTLKINSF